AKERGVHAARGLYSRVREARYWQIDIHGGRPLTLPVHFFVPVQPPANGPPSSAPASKFGLDPDFRQSIMHVPTAPLPMHARPSAHEFAAAQGCPSCDAGPPSGLKIG